MNLFWKKLLGQLKSTSAFEKEKKILSEKFTRYTNIINSRELAEYKDLYEIVKSANFKEKKKTLLFRKYKDTAYYRDSKKFSKLQSNKALQSYFDSIENESLKKFLAFKEHGNYEILGNKAEVKKSEELQQYKKTETSKMYKNYTRFNNSFIVEEYKKLKEHVNSPEFRKENDFWADKRRWFKTPEYETEQKFFKLADNPDIIFYEKTNPSIFDEIRDLELTFKDEFDGNTLNATNWDFGFRYPSYKLMGNHSFTNEKQANVGGKNTSANKSCLEIETKAETVKMPAWDTEKGFIEKTFNYTSDVLHTKTFQQKGGVFCAKIRCTGKLHHAFWLRGSELGPHINIFHFNGKNITMGNACKCECFEEVKISGICHSSYFVYSLEWNEKELIWHINNMEVFRTKNNIPTNEMFLLFNSFIPQSSKGKCGTLYVDWVKVFKKK